MIGPYGTRHPGSTINRDHEWRLWAKCRATELRQWFPREHPPEKRAVTRELKLKVADTAAKHCAGCPVKQECAVDALRAGEAFGIRAGVLLDTLSPPNRRRVLLSLTGGLLSEREAKFWLQVTA